MVLGLVGGCDAWTDQGSIQGCDNVNNQGLCAPAPPDPGTGGTGGSGGPIGDGACSNEDDEAVYDELTYTDENGNTFTGTDASSEVGSDCVFGTTSSDPVLEGCSDEAVAVLGCSPSCPDATVQALSDCVVDCTQGATGLSDECVACTGETVACGAVNCASVCLDPTAQTCIDCRCNNGCTPDFVVCSGIPSDDCGPIGGGGSGGGGPEGACINPDDDAVYEDLTYTDENGNTFTGTDASSEVGSDCVFGTTSSDPVLEGCSDEAVAVLGCSPSCPDATVQALSDCVVDCTQGATGLSDECVACTGETVACGAVNCASVCLDPTSQTCVDCRCSNNCTPNFVECSGIPSDDCG